MMQTEQKVNILLVDDRPENLIALESVLADLGQNLVMASSGREALKHLLDKDFAVILLDVQMPEMDGFETATLIRARARSQHTPIVFLTAINKTDTHVSRGYSVGGVDYVFKPFQPEVLKAKVIAFVELAKKTQELQEEVLRRQEAEEEVRSLNNELERRVAARTAELQRANRELKTEIAERQRAEEERAALLAREQAARATAEAAQKRLAFLGEASALLAGSLDYQLTLERLAHFAVPSLADFCIVDLLEGDGQFHRVATAHVDPSRDELMRELQRRYPPEWDSPQPASRVLRTGVAELVADVDDAWLQSVAKDADHLRMMRELAPRSYMVVPLVARGHTLGVMSFACTGGDHEETSSGRCYAETDLDLAADLGRRAAAAIDNARLFREVQEAGRRKDEFLAMLAHELRNPLAAISNADYALEEIGSEDARVARLHGIISRQSKHLARLVDDLLDISRITRGKIELRAEVVDLRSVVQQAVETVTPLLQSREQPLTVSLPDEAVWLRADPARLEQVVSNLLNNAAKYSEPQSPIWLTVEVEAAWCPPENGSHGPERGLPPATALVRVRDAGVGIPQDLLPRVFDMFAQAEQSLDRSQGGLGIGLALVNRLVQMHGGSVQAYSQGPGTGSEFVVRLPVVDGAAGTGNVADLLVPVASSHPGCRRILLVEDNPDAAETLSEILEIWGHDVRVAHHGSAAIEEVISDRPEVVLLDIGLPGMDGYEVARRLREEDPGRELLLVALTGYGQEEDRRRSQEAGFDFHLTKPVDPERLRELLTGVPERA